MNINKLPVVTQEEVIRDIILSMSKAPRRRSTRKRKALFTSLPRSRRSRRSRYKSNSFQNRRLNFSDHTYFGMGFPFVARSNIKTSNYASFDVAAAFQHYSLILNSAFDPLGDFGASQSPDYDKFALVYGAYEVISASVTVQFTNQQAKDIMITLFTNIQSTDPTDFHDAASQPGAIVKIAAEAQGQQVVLQTGKVNMRALMGKNDSTTQAATSASPSSQVQCHLSFWASDGAANTSGTVVIIVKQLVEFRNRAFYEDA